MKRQLLGLALAGAIIAGCAPPGGGGGTSPGGGGGGGGGGSSICPVPTSGSNFFFKVFIPPSSGGWVSGAGLLELTTGDILMVGNYDMLGSKKIFKATLSSQGAINNSQTVRAGVVNQSQIGHFRSQFHNALVYSNDGNLFFATSYPSQPNTIEKIQSDGTSQFIKDLGSNLQIVSLMNSPRTSGGDLITANIYLTSSSEYGYYAFSETNGEFVCGGKYGLPAGYKVVSTWVAYDLNFFKCIPIIFGAKKDGAETDLFIAVSSVSTSRTPPVQFEELIVLPVSGEAQNIDQVLQISDGYIILATTGTDSDNNGVPDYDRDTNLDILIIKVDGRLNLSWAKRLGGPKNDTANYVIEDGNFIIVVGSTFSPDGTGDIFVAKINKTSGNLEWLKGYNECSQNQDEDARFIVKGSGGNYHITGFVGGSFTSGKWYPFVLKIDQNGSLQGGCSAEFTPELAYSDQTITPTRTSISWPVNDLTNSPSSVSETPEEVTFDSVRAICQ